MTVRATATDVPKDQIDRAAAAGARAMVPPIALGLAILYALLTFAHYAVLSGYVRDIMMSVALASSVTASLIYQLRRSEAFWARFSAHTVLECLILIGHTNSMAHQALMPEPHHSTNILLGLLAASMVLWRRRTIIVMALGSWLHFYYVVSIGAASPLWLHFAFAMFLAQFVGTLNFTLRRRALYRFEQLRNNEQRAQHLYRDGQKLMAIGEIAGVMAHEINNPLAIASLQLQSLERRLNNNGENDVLIAITRTQRALSRIAGLVANLRESTREIDGGEFGRYPIAPLITKIIAEYQPLTTSTHINIKTVLPNIEGWCFMRIGVVQF
jgi:signal transduction histidine kinase